MAGDGSGGAGGGGDVGGAGNDDGPGGSTTVPTEPVTGDGSGGAGGGDDIDSPGGGTTVPTEPVAGDGSGGGGGGGDVGGGGNDDGPGGSTTVPTEPVTLDEGAFTYALSEATDALPLWTTPVTHKTTSMDRPPEGTPRSGLALSAARREFEPVDLVLGPASGTVAVEIDEFPELGSDQRVELAFAGYESGREETLTRLANGGPVNLDSSHGTPLWITVYVPDGAPAGEHTTSLTLTPSEGAPITVPITLTVFDFALPEEIHFKSQLNLSIGSLSGGSVDAQKTLLFEHRLTPASATWPSGFAWYITWDNERSPTQCSAFYDEPDEGEAYSIGHLGPRYLLGESWNGVGFPDSEIFQFVDNSTPRPETFCGIDRGDHYGTDAYNAEWSDWLSALDAYLFDGGFEDRVYYYVQNEPQDEEDYRLAAHLCRLTRAAAPHLRIAVSEEPKPEIAEDADGGCGYDIWIAHVRAYEEGYAWERQRDHGEEVWFYSLDHDPEPYFNPTSADRPGIDSRIIPWTAWSHRIRGWAYYDGGRFFPDGSPSVRAELLREGFEDYEYLYLANGNAHPSVDVENDLDATVASVAASMTSFTKDPDALMTLRYELGRYIEGSRNTLPVLEVQSTRPRGAYYINFQDPSGEPSAEPLVIDGNTYLKIGWGAYDAELGYGWSGEFITDPGIALYGYDDVQGYDERHKSYIYDDYGRDNLFEFALAPGRYSVTVGVGRPAHGYPGDPHNVSIEGEKVIDDELTTDASPTIERTVLLDITDGSLSMIAGGRSAATGQYSYTFLAYLAIQPVE